jgi:hypothetical protein
LIIFELITFHFLFLLRIVHILLINHLVVFLLVLQRKDQLLIFMNKLLSSVFHLFIISFKDSSQDNDWISVENDVKMLFEQSKSSFNASKSSFNAWNNLMINSFKLTTNLLRTILYCSKIDNLLFKRWISTMTSRIDEQLILHEKSIRHFANENTESSSETIEIEKKSCEQIDMKWWMSLKIDHTCFVKIANLRSFILFSRISTTISWANIDQTMNASFKKMNESKNKNFWKKAFSRYLILFFFVRSIID